MYTHTFNLMKLSGIKSKTCTYFVNDKSAKKQTNKQMNENLNKF